MSEQFWAVDRIVENIASLENISNGKTMDVPAEELPARTQEGDLLTRRESWQINDEATKKREVRMRGLLGKARKGK